MLTPLRRSTGSQVPNVDAASPKIMTFAKVNGFKATQALSRSVRARSVPFPFRTTPE
jgi:hypothetical protein